LFFIAPFLGLFWPLANAQNFLRVEDLAKIDHVTETNGVAVADYDQDGDLDIFFTGINNFNFNFPNTWNRLLQNQGDGTFKDVTVEAGFSVQYINGQELAARGEKMGASWGDYDNDGFPDLFLANSREDQLFRNNRNGTFEDVTQTAGVAGCNDCYTGSGLWWDHNRDGDLDLYVSNLRGPNIMFENNGNGTFSNVTEQTGLAGDILGITWSSVAVDIGKDGILDLLNMNDTQENQFFENRGSVYNEAARAYRLNDEGACMGVTVGDYNNDGFFDIYITNIFAHHPNPLFTNLGDRRFRDDAAPMDIDNSGWGWGTHFFDADHDGDEDLYAVNGPIDKLNQVPQPDINNFFFKNLMVEGTPTFEDWTVESGTGDLAKGKGMEVFDFDDDGDLDIVVANMEQAAYLYQNEVISNAQPEDKNWLKIWLEGTTTNRDGFGSEVKITIGEKSYYRWHHGAAIFGQSIQPVHFGVGSATTIDEIQIIWLSGRREVVYDVPVNQTLRLKEGQQELVTSAEDDIIIKEPAFQGNYPNPFDLSTTFSFELSKPGKLELNVYSVSGQKLTHLSKSSLKNGLVEIVWDGTDGSGNRLPAGLYFYQAYFNKELINGKVIKAN